MMSILLYLVVVFVYGPQEFALVSFVDGNVYVVVPREVGQIAVQTDLE